MAESKIYKIFKVDEGTLYMFTSNLCQTMRNDLDNLSAYGITEQNIDELYEQAREFIDTKSGTTYIYILAIEREKLIEQRNAVLDTVSSLGKRFELIWGSKSDNFKQLGLTAVKKLDNEKLIVIAKNLILSATNHLAELSATGLTQTMIDEYSIIIANFETKNQEMTQMKLARFGVTNLRVSRGNELYRQVIKYCNLGKTIHAGKDYSKYNQYIFYNESMGTLDAPSNLQYLATEGKIKWDHVSRAISYRVEYSTDSENFEKLKSVKHSEYIFGENQNRTGYYRIKARNLQNYSKYSEVLRVEER